MDGKTYSNLCSLKCENLELAYPGECQEESRTRKFRITGMVSGIKIKTVNFEQKQSIFSFAFYNRSESLLSIFFTQHEQAVGILIIARIFVGPTDVCLFLSSLLTKRKTIETRSLVHILPMSISKTVFFNKRVTLETASLKN